LQQNKKRNEYFLVCPGVKLILSCGKVRWGAYIGMYLNAIYHMKKLVKKRIGRLLHPLIIRLGYKSQQLESETSLLDEFFLVLQQMNLRPRHIIDVGANQGNWTRTALKYFPDAMYTFKGYTGRKPQSEILSSRRRQY
jgi:hypothetical protein